MVKRKYGNLAFAVVYLFDDDGDDDAKEKRREDKRREDKRREV
jgi:hypothetical protein